MAKGLSEPKEIAYLCSKQGGTAVIYLYIIVPGVSEMASGIFVFSLDARKVNLKEVNTYETDQDF